MSATVERETSSSGGGGNTPAGIATYSAPLSLQVDYVGGQNPIYVGHANPGSNAVTSSAVWQIEKFVYDGNNNPTSGGFANGTGAFTNIWDSRASYTYS